MKPAPDFQFLTAKGWSDYELLDSEGGKSLFMNCRLLFREQPLLFLMSAYAIRASAVSLYYALEEIARDVGRKQSCGELTLEEKSGGRLLSTAIFARWEK